MSKWSGMWVGRVQLSDMRYAQICSENVKWKAEQKVARYIEFMRQNGINTSTWQPYIARYSREMSEAI